MASVKVAELSKAHVEVGVPKAWYISSRTLSLISFLRRDSILILPVQETCAHAFVLGLCSQLPSAQHLVFRLQRADIISGFQLTHRHASKKIKSSTSQ